MDNKQRIAKFIKQNHSQFGHLNQTCLMCFKSPLSMHIDYPAKGKLYTVRHHFPDPKTGESHVIHEKFTKEELVAMGMDAKLIDSITCHYKDYDILDDASNLLDIAKTPSGRKRIGELLREKGMKFNTYTDFGKIIVHARPMDGSSVYITFSDRFADETNVGDWRLCCTAGSVELTLSKLVEMGLENIAHKMLKLYKKQRDKDNKKYDSLMESSENNKNKVEELLSQAQFSYHVYDDYISGNAIINGQYNIMSIDYPLYGNQYKVVIRISCEDEYVAMIDRDELVSFGIRAADLDKIKITPEQIPNLLSNDSTFKMIRNPRFWKFLGQKILERRDDWEFRVVEDEGYIFEIKDETIFIYNDGNNLYWKDFDSYREELITYEMLEGMGLSEVAVELIKMNQGDFHSDSKLMESSSPKSPREIIANKVKAANGGFEVHYTEMIRRQWLLNLKIKYPMEGDKYIVYYRDDEPDEMLSDTFTKDELLKLGVHKDDLDFITRKYTDHEALGLDEHALDVLDKPNGAKILADKALRDKRMCYQFDKEHNIAMAHPSSNDNSYIYVEFDGEYYYVEYLYDAVEHETRRRLSDEQIMEMDLPEIFFKLNKKYQNSSAKYRPVFESYHPEFPDILTSMCFEEDVNNTCTFEPYNGSITIYGATYFNSFFISLNLFEPNEFDVYISAHGISFSGSLTADEIVKYTGITKDKLMQIRPFVEEHWRQLSAHTIQQYFAKVGAVRQQIIDDLKDNADKWEKEYDYYILYLYFEVDNQRNHYAYTVSKCNDFDNKLTLRFKDCEGGLCDLISDTPEKLASMGIPVEVLMTNFTMKNTSELRDDLKKDDVDYDYVMYESFEGEEEPSRTDEKDIGIDLPHSKKEWMKLYQRYIDTHSPESRVDFGMFFAYTDAYGAIEFEISSEHPDKFAIRQRNKDGDQKNYLLSKEELKSKYDFPTKLVDGMLETMIKKWHYDKNYIKLFAMSIDKKVREMLLQQLNKDITEAIEVENSRIILLKTVYDGYLELKIGVGDTKFGHDISLKIHSPERGSYGYGYGYLPNLLTHLTPDECMDYLHVSGGDIYRAYSNNYKTGHKTDEVEILESSSATSAGNIASFVKPFGIGSTYKAKKGDWKKSAEQMNKEIVDGLV